MAKPIPDGYTSITPYLVVPDVQAQIDFLVKAFDAKVNLKMEMPGGGIGHADVIIFGSHVMMGGGSGHPPMPAMIHVYTADCDAWHARAVAAGGTVVMPIEDQFYGDRAGSVRDSNGNIWYLATHGEDVPEAELQRRMAEAHAKRKKEAK